MKKQKFNKKLVLNKETIAKLNGEEMNEVKGGTDTINTFATVCNSGCVTCQTCGNTCNTCYPCIETILQTCNPSCYCK